MKRVARRLLARFLDEDGSSTAQFAVMLPAVLYVFFAVFEGGMFMVRYVMLDQALDMTVRDLRLGILVKPSEEKLKQEICNRTAIFPDCMTDMKLELTRVDPIAWNFPTLPLKCVDRSEPIDASVIPPDPNIGVENDIMLVRACITARAMFPTTGVGLGLPKDSSGRYAVSSLSAYSNEP